MMECSIKVPNYQQELTSCMYQLQQKAVLCDAGLECKDGVIYVHKLVLISCGSRYLQQQVTTGNNTSSRIYVSLSEFTLKTVCCLVQTLYTGELKIFHENIAEFESLCNFIGLDKIVSPVQSLLNRENNVVEQDSREALCEKKEESTTIQIYEVRIAPDIDETNSMVDSTCDSRNVQMDTNSQSSQEQSAPDASTKNLLKRERTSKDPTTVSKKKIKVEESTEDESLEHVDTCSSGSSEGEDDGIEESSSNVGEILEIAKQLSTKSTEGSDESLKNNTDIKNCTCKLCRKVFIKDMKKIDDGVCKSCEILYSGLEQDQTVEENVQKKTEKESTSKPKQWKVAYKNQEKMDAAYEAVVKDKMAIRGAARKFGVPQSTLRDRIKRKGADKRQPGSEPVLGPQDSERLIRFFKIMFKRGYLSNREDMCTVGSHYAISLGKRKRDRPLTKHWFYYFCERYPEIKEMRTHLQQLEKTQTQDPSHVSSFFSYLVSSMTQYGLQDTPSLIYSIASADLSYGPPYFIDKSIIHEEVEKITVFACGNGSGEVIQPFFVFPEATKQLENLHEDCSPGFGYIADESLYECEVFLMYLKEHFSKHTPAEEHKILLVEGHKLFLSVDVMEWAEENNITIVVLPAQFSELLQPLEGDLLRNFERFYLQQCKEELSDSNELDRHTLCNAVNEAYKIAFKQESVKRAFQMSGIIPVNPSVC